MDRFRGGGALGWATSTPDRAAHREAGTAKEKIAKVILDRAKLNGVVICMAEEAVIPWEGTLGPRAASPHPSLGW